MQNKSQAQLARHLAHLKVVSRLLGHELHAQGSSKTITFSREQVAEIQTTIDLYIEEASARMGGPGGGVGPAGGSFQMTGDANLVPTRN